MLSTAFGVMLHPIILRSGGVPILTAVALAEIVVLGIFYKHHPDLSPRIQKLLIGGAAAVLAVLVWFLAE